MEAARRHLPLLHAQGGRAERRAIRRSGDPEGRRLPSGADAEEAGRRDAMEGKCARGPASLTSGPCRRPMARRTGPAAGRRSAIARGARQWRRRRPGPEGLSPRGLPIARTDIAGRRPEEGKVERQSPRTLAGPGRLLDGRKALERAGRQLARHAATGPTGPNATGPQLPGRGPWAPAARVWQ